MKDFDSARHAKRASEEDRTFTFGGEVFVAKTAVGRWVFKAYDRIAQNTSVGETLEIVDECVLMMIEDRDDAAARYHRVCENQDDPITTDDLMDLVKWLMEVHTDRPTGQPSASASGPTRTPPSLTPVSSSPDTPMESTG
jgi:hypothetical protein